MKDEAVKNYIVADSKPTARSKAPFLISRGKLLFTEILRHKNWLGNDREKLHLTVISSHIKDNNTDSY